MSDLFKLPASINVTAGESSKTDVVIFFADENGLRPKAANDIGDAAERLNEWLKRTRFDAKKGEVTSWSSKHDTAIIVGLPSKKLDAEGLRNLGTKLAKELDARGIASADVVLERFGLCGDKTLEALTYGLQLGIYHHNMKTEDSYTRSLCTVNFNMSPVTKSRYSADEMISKATATAEGSMFMKKLVELPPNVLGTRQLAEAAQHISKLFPAVKVNIKEQAELEAEGFGCLTAVGRASAQDSLIVELRYEGDADAPLQALIGKGLVHDSGGYSLKPDGGKGMKGDMGGAALVLGSIYAAAATGSAANLVGVIGAVENSIDGSAYRPDDVLTSLLGKTVEVTNTDAEGRLVLADALTYAERTYKPAAMFSFATLTGHAVLASGKRAPIFSDNEALIAALESAAKSAGEMVLHFPMDAYLWADMESRIADMVNANTNRMAPGHTLAAMFLHKYVETAPYVHVDIAGACDLWGPDGGLYGVRMMLGYLDNTATKS